MITLDENWHERPGFSSPEIPPRIGTLVFASKAGFGIPKILLAEDYFEVTDVAQVMQAALIRRNALLANRFPVARRLGDRVLWRWHDYGFAQA